MKFGKRHQRLGGRARHIYARPPDPASPHARLRHLLGHGEANAWRGSQWPSDERTPRTFGMARAAPAGKFAELGDKLLEDGRARRSVGSGECTSGPFTLTQRNSRITRAQTAQHPTATSHKYKPTDRRQPTHTKECVSPSQLPQPVAQA